MRLLLDPRGPEKAQDARLIGLLSPSYEWPDRRKTVGFDEIFVAAVSVGTFPTQKPPHDVDREEKSSGFRERLRLVV
jgi:hypothetical protein